MKRLILDLGYKNIHTEKIAVVRTMLAIGTLSTLIFNDISLLTNLSYVYDDEPLQALKDGLVVHDFSIYNLFSPLVAKIISIIILLLVISGYYPAFTCWLHAWVTISITNSVAPVDGGDQIASNLALLLIPLCLTDFRKNQWEMPGRSNAYINVFANCTVFFICIQAAIVYLHAAVGKLNTDVWKEGTAAFYWLSDPSNGAPDWLRSIYETLTLSSWLPVLTWSVLLLELFLFACIFAGKRIKAFFLVCALFFHFFIILTHGLFSFFFSMTALLIIYLDDMNYSVKLTRSVKLRFAQKPGVLIEHHVAA